MNIAGLRPLSLGEQMDRAVTLCVRHAGILSLIYLVFGVSIGSLQWSAAGDQSESARLWTEIFNAHPTRVEDITAILHQHTGATTGLTFVFWTAYILLSPLMQAALTCAAASLYLGKPVTFRSAYEQGLRSWLPLIGINVLYAIFSLVLYVGMAIAWISATLAAALIAVPAKPVAVILAVIAGLIGLAVLLSVLMLVWVAINLSYTTRMVERLSFFSACIRGMERICSRESGLRALLAASALGAVFCGFSIVELIIVVLIYGFLHSTFLGILAGVLLQIVQQVFITVFFVVFYFDIRIRREGFDLQREITQLPATS